RAHAVFDCLLCFCTERPVGRPVSLFFFPAPPTPAFYTLSLHDALPIFIDLYDNDRLIRHVSVHAEGWSPPPRTWYDVGDEIRYRSEEHTSELQSRFDLVCRLLLEKKNKKTKERKLDVYSETESTRSTIR